MSNDSGKSTAKDLCKEEFQQELIVSGSISWLMCLFEFSFVPFVICVLINSFCDKYPSHFYESFVSVVNLKKFQLKQQCSMNYYCFK